MPYYQYQDISNAKNNSTGHMQHIWYFLKAPDLLLRVLHHALSVHLSAKSWTEIGEP